MPSTFDIILRLIVAVVLSSIVGLEREYYRKPAGLRTMALVGLGSALFTIASFRVKELFPAALVDPTRIAAQIVTGIGFIGAGAIIRAQASIVGLTTAAMIFAVAAIGMAAGFGLYTEAIAATVITLASIYGLSYLVMIIRKHSKVPPPSLDDQKEKPSSDEIVMH